MATSVGTSAELTKTSTKSGVKQTLLTYLELTKLKIVALLLFTTVTAMVIAAGGQFELLGAVILPTLIGGALSAGGASALNQYIDRDLDARMSRTARRPIPSGRVAPINALLFGLVLVVWSTLILGVFVNWLAAVLALFGGFYYVVIYTIILKRNTVLNILIGGGAGAIPVLVGWSAVTGSLNFEAFLLFAIVFYWTPPHSWALALLVNSDYARANVPMMPVARGEDVTRQQILLYSVQLLLITLLPVVFGTLNAIYLLAAVALGLGLIRMALLLMRRQDGATARSTYKYSTMYLAALFLAMIVDAVILV
ncbi:MAG: protoheme IX farnesyltransferase [Chloroflexi bacterium]|nr:protoheme IX farnesyltransferase [Chloroflexota bacterium]